MPVSASVERVADRRDRGSAPCNKVIEPDMRSGFAASIRAALNAGYSRSNGSGRIGLPGMSLNANCRIEGPIFNDRAAISAARMSDGWIFLDVIPRAPFVRGPNLGAVCSPFVILDIRGTSTAREVTPGGVGGSSF